MDEPHIKCESGWLMGASEIADCQPNVPSPLADEMLPIVKVEPLPVISSEDDDQEDGTSIKEEYEIEDLSVHPSTDNQVMGKDDLKPFTSTFEKELDVDAVKEHSTGIKDEIFIDEHKAGQHFPCFEEDNKSYCQLIMGRMFSSLADVPSLPI
ncbi:uncharacterized protein [Anabrus simplex]|uniref:uncharacterized protein isoform X3 n=1 Tax=Anabrus simplex TaxID=316456 RepID=UPI0035A28E38